MNTPHSSPNTPQQTLDGMKEDTIFQLSNRKDDTYYKVLTQRDTGIIKAIEVVKKNDSNFWDEVPKKVRYFVPSQEIDVIKPHIPNSLYELFPAYSDWPDSEFTDEHVNKSLPYFEGYVIDTPGSHIREDAVFAEKHEQGWKLYVHISDITFDTKHSVESILRTIEEPSRKKGDSKNEVKNPLITDRWDRSSKSLFSRFQRETISFILDVSPEGKVVKYEIAKARFKCLRALDFEEADLERQNPNCPDQANLQNLQDVCQALYSYRLFHGLLNDYEFKKIQPDSTPESMTDTQGNFENIINECMTQINQIAGQFFLKEKTPAAYSARYDEVTRSFLDLQKNNPYAALFKNNPIDAYRKLNTSGIATSDKFTELPKSDTPNPYARISSPLQNIGDYLNLHILNELHAKKEKPFTLKEMKKIVKALNLALKK